MAGHGTSVDDYRADRRSSGTVRGAGARWPAANHSVWIISAIRHRYGSEGGEHNACMGRTWPPPWRRGQRVMPRPYPLQAQGGPVRPDDGGVPVWQPVLDRSSPPGFHLWEREGGCQAEVGSASGMAAAALVHARAERLRRWPPPGHGAAERAARCATRWPGWWGARVKRNVIGAVNALACADMALAGIAGPSPAMRSSTPWPPCLAALLRPAGRAAWRPCPPGRWQRVGLSQPDDTEKELLVMYSTISILM